MTCVAKQKYYLLINYKSFVGYADTNPYEGNTEEGHMISLKLEHDFGIYGETN